MSWPLESGLVDSSPLTETAKALFQGKEIKKKLVTSSVDASTGEILHYNENMPREDIITSVIASASIPCAFPPQYLRGKTLIDGGSALNLDLPAMVNRCKEIVEKDEDIIVDVIWTDNDKTEGFEEDGGAHTNFLRGGNI